MSFKIELISLIPSLLCFGLSVYLSFLSLYVLEETKKREIMNISIYIFISGLIFATLWIIYWGVKGIVEAHEV